VSVVKAFNRTFAGTLVEGEVAGEPLDVFVAGDEEGPKATVAELARAGGLNPIASSRTRAGASRVPAHDAPGQARDRLYERREDDLLMDSRWHGDC
jgi:hypothetical protein